MTRKNEIIHEIEILKEVIAELGLKIGFLNADLGRRSLKKTKVTLDEKEKEFNLVKSKIAHLESKLKKC